MNIVRRTIKTLFLNTPIEPLNIGVLLRLARLTEFQANATRAGPHVHRANHPLGRQREINVDPSASAIVVIEHVEQTKIPPIAQLVAHEILRPHLLDRRRHRERLRRPQEIRAELRFGVHLFQTPILLLQHFHARHQWHVHAAELSPPVV